MPNNLYFNCLQFLKYLLEEKATFKLFLIGYFNLFFDSKEHFRTKESYICWLIK